MPWLSFSRSRTAASAASTSCRSRHSPLRLTTSRSHARMARCPPGRAVDTMSWRAWEKDAVFRPMPNRPRSFGPRAVDGPLAAMVIAVTSSASVIPSPSSMTATQESRPSQVNSTLMLRACAVMQLSTRSATAASTV